MEQPLIQLLSMLLARAALALCFCIIGCTDTERIEKRWTSKPGVSSPYSATLIERREQFALGESDRYSVRVDAAPRGDDGWFFRERLDTDLADPPPPNLRWTSATDLLIIVHSARVDGQRRRRFGGGNRPKGSLIVRFLADQADR